jgi:sirohydrochlorin cobaltochelatase
MTTGLVLAGHGSHLSPHTAELVWQQVDALRALGVADEVTAAFWKEQPSFSQVLDTLSASDITVIPLFTAQGYFTQTVIPTEMGLHGERTTQQGRLIRYTRTLGEHPYLEQVVHQRVADALHALSVPSDQVTVAIIGHSTRRNTESRQATERQVDSLRAARLVKEVIAVYLDDQPSIPQIYALSNTPHLIAVPFFLANGSHTTLDVPAQLGLAAGQQIGEVQGHQVYYTPPVGTESGLQAALLGLAAAAGAPLYTERPVRAWAGFPSVGRAELASAVAQAGVLHFGQLRLTAHEVRPIGDSSFQTFYTPSALRNYLRQPTSGFRPLATANDLPTGWRVAIEDADMLHAVVETVYPSAAALWAAARNGTLSLNSLEATCARQTGAFRALASLSAAAQHAVSACANCAAHPLWLNQHTAQAWDGLPCAEPCNMWLSQALQALTLSESEEGTA